MTKEFPSIPVVGEVIPLNAGDVESTLAYWADDAIVQLIGVLADIQVSYNGKQQVRSWLEDLVVHHVQIEVKVIRVQGNTVIARRQTWSDLTGQPDAIPLVTTEVYVVKDGKIISLTSTVSPASRLRFQVALEALYKNRGGELKQEE